MKELAPEDIRALREALARERRLASFHDRVLDRFGPLPTLARVRAAEQLHIDVLRSLHVRFGVPVRRERGDSPRLGTLAETCQRLIHSELERADRYRSLRSEVSDILVKAELRNLERASRLAHLPAVRQIAKTAHGRGRRDQPPTMPTGARAPQA